jgi:hypothetical protein
MPPRPLLSEQDWAPHGEPDKQTYTYENWRQNNESNEYRAPVKYGFYPKSPSALDRLHGFRLTPTSHKTLKFAEHTHFMPNSGPTLALPKKGTLIKHNSEEVSHARS